MRRSLRKRIIRASHRLALYKEVKVVVLFARDTFTNAPLWSPGEGFTPTIDHYSWYRRNSDGLVTAVVAGIQSGPANNTQEPTPEIWTVLLDTAAEDGESLFFELWNKPHRVRWLSRPGNEANYGCSRIVSRTPMHPAHQLNRVREYWDMYRHTYGFEPSWAFFKGCMDRGWISFGWLPGLYGADDLNDILDAVAVLAKNWQFEVRVYPGQNTELSGNDFASSIVRRRGVTVH